MAWPRSPAVLLALLALGSCTKEPERPAPAAATAAPAPTPKPEAARPLPPPGEAGVRARHGGLVAAAGPVYLELSIAGERVLVHACDAAGEPLRPARADGRLTATGAAGPVTVELGREEGEGGEVRLAGRGRLEDRFTADLEVSLDGQSRRARLAWVRGGQRGDWSEPRPLPAATAGAP
jgi:hypothetical protein